MVQNDGVAPNGRYRVFGGKILAALIDVGVVVGPTLLAVAAFHERFRFVPTADGVTFAPADQERINQIDSGFSRAVEVGDSLYTLSGTGWWLSLGLLVGLTAVVYVVTPALFRLRTPGQLAMRVAPELLEEPELVATIDLTAPTERLAADRAMYGSDTSTLDLVAESADASRGEPRPIGKDRATDEDQAADGDRATDEDQTADENQDLWLDISDQVTDRPDAADITGNTDEPDVVHGADELAPQDTVDITDGAPTRAITLADESDYVRWERNQPAGEQQPPQPRSGGSAFDMLALPESSLSEMPLTTATLIRDRSSARPAKEASAAGSTLPVWNEDWNAWLYWDEGKERWFRHDTDIDRWLPLP